MNNSWTFPSTSLDASRQPSKCISIPFPKIFLTIISVCRAAAQRNSSRT